MFFPGLTNYMKVPRANACKCASYASHGIDYRCKWTLLGSQVIENDKSHLSQLCLRTILIWNLKIAGQIFKPFAQRRGDIQVYHWVVLLSLGYKATPPFSWWEMSLPERNKNSLSELRTGITAHVELLSGEVHMRYW